MALVGYSDSEDSDSEHQLSTHKTTEHPPTHSPGAPIRYVEKAEKRSHTGKAAIKLSVPQPASAQNLVLNSEGSSQEPPLKKVRTESGFQGFNSLLPAPKKSTVVSNENEFQKADDHKGAKAVGSRHFGTSLKTGAAPSFNRTEVIKDASGTASADIRSATADSELPMLPRDHKASLGADERRPDVELVGRNTIFKPLSVTRKSSKKTPSFGINGANKNDKHMHAKEQPKQNKSPSSDPPVKRERIPLFATTNEEPSEDPCSNGNGDYKYMFTEDTKDRGTDENGIRVSTSFTSDHPVGSKTPSKESNLQELANNLGLSASERRQLFGRNGRQTDAQVAEFSLAAEYYHNRELNDNESAIPSHNPVRAIAPGKHSLQQLVNAANSQKDALEESFASGKRNKKDAGRKYGW